MTILLNKHVKDTVLTVTLCDEEQLNKQLEEDKLFLDTTGSFYAGKETSKEDIKDYLIKARNISAVGEESVNIVKETFPDITIKIVQGIPFAQIYKF